MKGWAGTSYLKLQSEGISKSDYFNYEDTLQVIGSYIKSLAFRIQVCKKENLAYDSILNEAKKLLGEIENLQNKNSTPGLLTKPYGGRPSNEISIDQYADVFYGLFEFSKIADADTLTRIKYLFELWAQFWISIDYKWQYFGNDVNWANPITAIVLMTFMQMTFRLTGNDLFLKAAKDLQENHNANFSTVRASSIWRKENDFYFCGPHLLHHTIMESLSYLLELCPEQKDNWLNQLYEYWRLEANPGVDIDGLQYWCLKIHQSTNVWLPVSRHDFNKESCDTFFTRLHRCKSAKLAAHTAWLGVIMARNIPMLKSECLTLSDFILQKLNNPLLMLESFDPTGRELPDGQAQRGQAISGKCFGHWLSAYWAGRLLGFWSTV